MHIQDIRAKTQFEEIDYLFLKEVLKDYSQPRNKIRSLLKSNALIRIKKGLYIFGSEAARRPYSKELLANLIYGPSAISLEYALGFYGMIPERVEELTSITNKRHKTFITPVGRFSYQYLHSDKYPIGITQITLQNNCHVLMATPEKALCDVLMLRGGLLETQPALKEYLFENLRLEEETIAKFDMQLLIAIENRYNHSNVHLLKEYLIGKRST